METAGLDQSVIVPAPHRILLTGATGFVGSALLRAVADNADYELTCSVRERAMGVDQSESRSNATISCGRKVVIGNIDGDTKWADALNGVNTVIHLAARVHIMNEKAVNPLAEFRQVNLDGTLNLARQAVTFGVKRFVFLSSVKVNGEDGHFSERDNPFPMDAYGTSKYEAEVGLHEIAARTGLEVVIIRPPLVYGPGVKANFRSLLRMVQRGVPMPFGAIHNQRSFVAVDNLVSLILVCARDPRAAGETFFVSDGYDLSTTDLLRRMGKALDKPARLLSVPEGLLEFGLSMLGKRAMAQRLLGTLQVDIRHTQRTLDWSPPVTIDDALRRTVASL